MAPPGFSSSRRAWSKIHGPGWFQIEGADGSEAPRLVKELPFVRGVTQLGLRLRVLVDRGQADAERQLRALLKQHEIDATLARTHASLEDVFVVATRNGSRGQ